MSPYSGIDYYDLDSLLSEDELSVREMVHDLVQNEFMPLIHEHHKNETFPTDMVGRLGELGLLGSNLPEEYAAPVSTVWPMDWLCRSWSGEIRGSEVLPRFRVRW